jgi:glycosyl transferase family 87
VPSRRGLWIAAYALVVAAFLASVTRYYHPGLGFTAFIDFPAGTHSYELPAVQNAPHFDNPASPGYDGVFYAQLAVEPLLRDAAIDRALDNPPYRARRILFSWTAYALGAGRPGWILKIYSIQNVIAWLLMAWLLCRWMRPSTPRAFVLWAGCLLSPGMLSSVRYALPDAPSALLVACAVAAAEARRPLMAAAIVGLAALGRETSLLASTALATTLRRNKRTWLILTACGVLCILPLALWVDYLRSIYRSDALANPGQITTPLSGLLWKVSLVRSEFIRSPFALTTLASGLAVVAFLAQGGWVIRELLRSGGRSAWALAGTSYLVLGLVAHVVVWEGTPGAFTRVLLPLAIAANVLLAARPQASWAIIVAANLAAVPAALLFSRG